VGGMGVSSSLLALAVVPRNFPLSITVIAVACVGMGPLLRTTGRSHRRWPAQRWPGDGVACRMDSSLPGSLG
jgi:hypothetical protein